MASSPLINAINAPLARRNDEDGDPQAIATLRTLGIPIKTLRCGKREDWDGLGLELDRFSAFGYGAATQRQFLHAPHPRLQMRTPVEALAEAGGIARVRLAVRQTLAAHGG